MPCANWAASRCGWGSRRRCRRAARQGCGEALESADIVLLSGGTSKGAGDVSYRVVAELTDPGIVAHGVALKPGKPICLAATGGRPVVVLPGFPTSAIFTFHEFVAPVLSRLAGRAHEERDVGAGAAAGQGQQRDRPHGISAGRAGRGSPIPTRGSADDPESRVADSRRWPRIRWARDRAASRRSAAPTASRRSAGTRRSCRPGPIVDVQLLGRELQLADLVVIGSHCIGLDYLLGELQQRGVRSKFLAVGSLAGLEAAKRGECDVAGIHLLDPKTGEYNRPFLTPRAGSDPRLRADCRESSSAKAMRGSRGARPRKRSPRRCAIRHA